MDAKGGGKLFQAAGRDRLQEIKHLVATKVLDARNNRKEKLENKDQETWAKLALFKHTHHTHPQHIPHTDTKLQVVPIKRPNRAPARIHRLVLRTEAFFGGASAGWIGLPTFRSGRNCIYHSKPVMKLTSYY